MKYRLDQQLVSAGLVVSRSQAESYIKLGQVEVAGRIITKPGYMVVASTPLRVTAAQQYVSRAALKLASVSRALQLNFSDKIVLDVGSSTGGFTEYALSNGATKVIAVELGKNQMHPTLRDDPRIELYEKTDIRNVLPFRAGTVPPGVALSAIPDMVLADVSFVSLRDILPSVARLVDRQTQIIVMVKPQFEAAMSSLKHKGVIKNDAMRRTILKDFELWALSSFVLVNKADSDIAGAKGNVERFYELRLPRSR